MTENDSESRQFMRAVLVTGGAGYIGSHTCKVLAEAGFLPVAYDNMVHGHAEAVKWGPLEEGDIADRDRLDEVLQSYQPIAVIHFAAYAYVGESVLDPGKYYSNNVAGTLSLLEAMRARALKTLIFSSTCATYGIPETQPITEDTPQRPINPYGSSKLMIEQILADYAASYGFNTVALRYFNACGADPEGQIGEDHDPEPHLIPRCIMAASGSIEKLDVFGIDYPTPDGTCVRDYVHVADLARAHVQALHYLNAGGRSEMLNLGTGRGYTVREVIAAVEEVTGLKVPVQIAPRRAGDPAVLLANPARARKILGFSTEINSLNRMVETAWCWHQARHRIAIPSTADPGGVAR
jgi:UDP-glucose-4-epimerase GalE